MEQVVAEHEIPQVNHQFRNEYLDVAQNVVTNAISIDVTHLHRLQTWNAYPRGLIRHLKLTIRMTDLNSSPINIRNEILAFLSNLTNLYDLQVMWFFQNDQDSAFGWAPQQFHYEFKRGLRLIANQIGTLTRARLFPYGLIKGPCPSAIVSWEYEIGRDGVWRLTRGTFDRGGRAWVAQNYPWLVKVLPGDMSVHSGLPVWMFF